MRDAAKLWPPIAESSLSLLLLVGEKEKGAIHRRQRRRQWQWRILASPAAIKAIKEGQEIGERERKNGTATVHPKWDLPLLEECQLPLQ